jgi:ubiquinone/menaquinone biosynthesis C-methylase UbiE
MPENYTFEAFSQHNFYQMVNRHLIDTTLRLSEQSRRPAKRVLDLACGTGAATKLLIEELEEHGDRAEVIAVDSSESALEQARELIGTRARFVRGTAESFAVSVPTADVIIFCNAIHLLAQKDCVVEQAHEVLRRGGVLAFNTTFYEGAYTPGTERFYRLWMLRALQMLRKGHPELTLDRSHPEAMKWLTPEEYRELLDRHGFVVEHMSAEVAEMTPESAQDISHYSEFVKGALPGIPVEVGAPILMVAVAQAFRELKMEILPRNWLQVVARTA